MSEQRYLIWSEEHGLWWSKSKSAYTDSIFRAGRFSQKEASEIIKNANAFLDPAHEPPLNEIAVPDPLEWMHL